jgi:hypothetical protein
MLMQNHKLQNHESGRLLKYLRHAHQRRIDNVHRLSYLKKLALAADLPCTHIFSTDVSTMTRRVYRFVVNEKKIVYAPVRGYPFAFPV